MTLLLTTTAILVAISLVLAFLVQGGFSRRRRTAPGFWRRLWIRQALLLPVYVFVVVPGIFGFVGSRIVGTRGDERAYPGPILDAAGNWQIQDRDTLRDAAPLSREIAAAIEDRRHRFESPDGIALQAYYVPAPVRPPRAVVLMAHGLFRNAMELEPVAAMLRELGCDVFLVELANHGGSGRRPFTFGMLEQEDILAAVAHLRAHLGAQAQAQAHAQSDANGSTAPLILYGVSLGAVAVALAAPQVEGLAGLVLEAPATDLRGTAYRQLGREPWKGRQGLGFPRPYAWLVMWSLELWSGFDFDEVRPIDAYAALPPGLPVLFIGAGRDYRMPPPIVAEAFAAVPAPEGVKQLWIEPAATHGRVSSVAPEEYRRRLAALLDRAAPL